MGVIAVDLDGTLAEYHGFRGAEIIGKPIQPMVDQVKKWLAEGRNVVIFTARVSSSHAERSRKAIEKWCIEHIGTRLEVTCIKDYSIAIFIDDRARQVVFNTGEIIGEIREGDL